ncbi:MAG: hypothetical protein D6706_01615 [Chloroflexi bacterium]|nr:MAG: hypothetical protein D6706_01615 [Chloroflexota bacterium]
MVYDSSMISLWFSTDAPQHVIISPFFKNQYVRANDQFAFLFAGMISSKMSQSGHFLPGNGAKIPQNKEMRS